MNGTVGRRSVAVVAAITVTAVVAIALAAVSLRTSSSSSTRNSTKSSEAGSERQAGRTDLRQSATSVPPSCSIQDVPPIASLIIRANAAGNNFDQDCYYVPAGQVLSVTLVASVFALNSGVPVPMRLIISSTDSPAISAVPDQPGLSQGDLSSAIVVGPSVLAPNSAQIKVPVLTPGSYELRVMGMPHFEATLQAQ